jgi:hypothetical protein
MNNLRTTNLRTTNLRTAIFWTAIFRTTNPCKRPISKIDQSSNGQPSSVTWSHYFYTAPAPLLLHFKPKLVKPFFAKRLFSTALNLYVYTVTAYSYCFAISSPINVLCCHRKGMDLSFHRAKNRMFLSRLDQILDHGIDIDLKSVHALLEN